MATNQAGVHHALREHRSASEWVSDTHRLTSGFRHASNVRLTVGWEGVLHDDSSDELGCWLSSRTAHSPADSGALQAERDAPLTRAPLRHRIELITLSHNGFTRALLELAANARLHGAPR